MHTSVPCVLSSCAQLSSVHTSVPCVLSSCAQLSSVHTSVPCDLACVFLDPISSTYGYLTWEWQKAIRGYTHPLVFATLYKLLSCLHLDWPSLLVLLPRVVVQAPLAAAADYHVFKLASLLYGSNVGWYAVSSSSHLSSSSSFSSSSPPPPPPFPLLLLPLPSPPPPPSLSSSSPFPLLLLPLPSPPPPPSLSSFTYSSFCSFSFFPLLLYLFLILFILLLPLLLYVFLFLYLLPLLLFCILCFITLSQKNTSTKIMSTTALTVFQLLCNLASWFTFYSITRTLSNSIEAALTPVVVYYWLLATQTARKSNTGAQKYITCLH